MFRNIVVIALAIFVSSFGHVVAQDNAQRTRDLVASLDKTKYKKKEKANISVEVFVDIKNEPVVRLDRGEYSGIYEADGYKLDLRVSPDGRATGSGFDSFASSDKQMSFTLKNAKIDGALISGTKVYDNGSEHPFEAVFVNRRARSGSNPKLVSVDITQYGIGFVQTANDTNAGWTNRVFLEKK
jgi:hypothetical protein